VSGSSKLAKVTDGAVSFDGTGDYLSLADSADFNLAGNDFTIEAFVYHKGAFSSFAGIIAQWVASSGSDRPFVFEADSNGDIEFYYYDTSDNFVGPVQGGRLSANRWHHVAACRSGSTIRMFVDGVMYGTGTSISVNIKNGTGNLTIGGQVSGSNYYWTGFISNARIINGTALYTANFTPPFRTLTNVTNTKLLCCQSNTSAIAAAVKPGTITANGNAAATNFNPFNTDINTVRGQETGYATLNPLDLDSTNASLSNGNLTISSTTNAWTGVRGTTEFPSSGGKWYFEVLYVSGTYFNVGIDVPADGAVGDLSGANSIILYEDNGTVRYNNQGSTGTISTTIDPGMTFGVAVNHDSKSIQFYINNILTHSATYTTPKVPAVSGYGTWTGDANFGQKPFKFPPPEGHQPLNAANVKPETVTARPDHYVGSTIYTGTTANPATINSENNFTPDLVWIKTRSNAEGHAIYDSVRGPNSRLRSDSANQQTTGVNELKSFIPGGFTTANNDHIYYNSVTFIAWMWKAGGAPTATNDNTSGAMDANSVSIDGVLQSAYTPSGSPTIYPKKMSIGTRQGFSIIEYNGNNSTDAKLPHGLSQAPDFLTAKAMDYNGRNWQTFHKSMGNTRAIRLDSSDAQQAAASGWWNNTSPTSDIVTLGNSGDANQGGDPPLTYIMYCWHDVPGLQKFGKYTANNSANGTFVELGFKPAIIWLKPVTRTGNWTVIDVKRDTFNVTTKRLSLNLTTNEGDQVGTTIDILSNGFKCRTDSGDVNNSTETYLYCAWAEAPTFNLYGGQSNAR
jgi:hypothetical protein